ncbi:Uncharacterised protein [Yersinia similis]|uniref:Uncharacterized protein n=1 Tax=Yersinia similis TaxID=367190 RepID=A0A0T9R8P5_9GAMM|nr:Uncharacterised protein [Yersinia similis]CNC22670.1 Uncharacterised protein [Yersinia similis]CNI49730.1 Uncharacterised protein [Yersinia similis]
MDYRVTFTPEAEQQIVDLHRYITQNNLTGLLLMVLLTLFWNV